MFEPCHTLQVDHLQMFSGDAKRDGPCDVYVLAARANGRHSNLLTSTNGRHSNLLTLTNGRHSNLLTVTNGRHSNLLTLTK